MTTKTPKNTLSLYGNLGGDPEPHTIEAKSGTRTYYDPIIDDAVETSYDLPERNFLTFSLATGGYGDKPLRWHYCVDWEGVAFRLRKGDRIKARRPATSRTAPTRRTARPRASGSSWSSATSR
jgi:hypothetical protein